MPLPKFAKHSAGLLFEVPHFRRELLPDGALSPARTELPCALGEDRALNFCTISTRIVVSGCRLVCPLDDFSGTLTLREAMRQ